MKPRKLAMLVIPVILLLFFSGVSPTFASSYPRVDKEIYEMDVHKSDVSTPTPSLEFLDIHTEPSTVHVGESFRINAIVINSTPNTISVKFLCSSPLSAAFDKNVVPERVSDCTVSKTVELKAGEKYSLFDPNAGPVYRAIRAGVTNATVFFTYGIQDEYPTASKSFVFTILGSNPLVGSERVFIRASSLVHHVGDVSVTGGLPKLFASWNLNDAKGIILIVPASKNDTGQLSTRITLRFTPITSTCMYKSLECIDGLLTYSNSDQYKQGSKIHLEADIGAKLLLASVNSADSEHQLDLIVGKMRMKSIVILGEDQEDGPLLVQEIYADHIVGLNLIEAPIPGISRPVTVNIGESVGNGCTVTLTLLEIHEKTATFLKTIDPYRDCPICWHDKS